MDDHGCRPATDSLPMRRKSAASKSHRAAEVRRVRSYGPVYGASERLLKLAQRELGMGSGRGVTRTGIGAMAGSASSRILFGDFPFCSKTGDSV